MLDPLDEIERVFDEVQKLPRAERAAYLRERCADRPELRREVESLLRHADSSFLEDPPTATRALATEADTPRTIGPYTLIERLGEGGFGVVWRAEQSQPIQRTVALKLVRSGVASSSTIARFEAERQALASLDHPGIARIHEAGSTPDGRPWFAMELVDGLPITEYCTRHRVGLADRIRLVATICDAVQHAHERGIVHRDLKPTNVLVSHDSGRARPKVIDFGVSKALEVPLVDALHRTEAGQIVGTPAYMSPEQARGDIAAIDARTDVHALGVMLFELITGTLPFEPERSGTPDLVGLQQKIRDDDAPRPSSRIVERLASPGYRSPVLARAVRGDLDWIVLRALEKDPDRRYPSAAELGLDLLRFLADEPVEASPPSRWYRTRKLLRRHRVASIAVATGVLALTIGVAATIVGFVRARESERDALAARDRALESETLARDSERLALRSLERARASETLATTEAAKLRAVFDFLVSMLSGADPGRGLGRDVTVRQILDDARQALDVAGLAPQVELALRYTIGSSYNAAGRARDAAVELQKALERAYRLAARERCDVRGLLGIVLVRLGRLDEAEKLATEALGFAVDARDRIDALGTLATTCTARARFAEAEGHLREAIELADHTPDCETVQTTNRIQLGDLLERQSRYEEAEEIVREARRLAVDQGPKGRFRVLRADRVLVQLLVRHGKGKEAIELARANVALALEVHGENHPDSAHVQSELAEILQENDEPEESEQLFRRAIATMQRAVPNGSPSEAQARGNLGWLLSRLDRNDEAEEMLRSSLAMRRAIFGPVHPEVASSLNDISVLLREKQAYAESEQLAREALAAFESTLGPRHLHTQIARHSLGVTLTAAGRAEQAIPYLADALDGMVALLAPEHWQIAEARKRLARALMDLGRFEESKAQVLLAHEAMVRAHGAEHRRAQSLVKTMIDLALEAKDWALANTWREKLVAGDRDYAVDVQRQMEARGR
ncbi:MAG: serine/threonine protein kinase [Planctomycetes bacterium]|nr:serine/threonine protein kinase [Planctomycetota bacterium]